MQVVFFRENRNARICRLRFRWQSDAREHRREFRKGDFTKPSDDCQGLSRGPPLRGFAWRVIEVQGDGIKARYGVSGTNQYLLGKYCRSSPLVFSFTTPRCQGLCGSQKSSSGLWSNAELAWFVPSQAPWSQVQGSAPAEQEAVVRIVGRRSIANRLCHHVRSVGGRVLDPLAFSMALQMRGRCSSKGNRVGALHERSNRLNSEPHTMRFRLPTCPGMARIVNLGPGRWENHDLRGENVLAACLAPCAKETRRARPVRRHATSSPLSTLQAP